MTQQALNIPQPQPLHKLYLCHHIEGEPLAKIGISNNHTTLQQRITRHRKDNYRLLIEVDTPTAHQWETQIKTELRNEGLIIAGREWFKITQYSATLIINYFDAAIHAHPNPQRYYPQLAMARKQLNHSATLTAERAWQHLSDPNPPRSA